MRTVKMKQIQMDLVVPFHKVDEFFIECLNSIESQKDLKLRVIFVDDRKTEEDLPAKIKILGSKTIKTGGVGYPKAVRSGLREVESEYAAFLDSDDTMDPYRLRTQLDNLIHTGSSLNYCKIQSVAENGKAARPKLGELNTSNQILPLLLGSYGANSSWVFDSNLIQNPNFMTGDYLSIDWITALKLFPHIKTSYTPEYLYYYRKNPAQMTKASNYKKGAFVEVYPYWRDLAISYDLPGLSFAEAEALATSKLGSSWNVNMTRWLKSYLELVAETDKQNFNSYEICVGARQAMSHAKISNFLRLDNKSKISKYIGSILSG